MRSIVKTILFQGDSITDAGRSRENDHEPGMGYPVMIRGAVGFDHPGEYQFLNRGISGDRVVDVYARIKRDIINLEPDIMSILIGVNDVWHELNGRKNGVDAEKYFRIYSMLIEEVREALPDVKIMILEPFVLKGTATEAEWEIFDREVRVRAQMAKKVAEKFDLPFVPLQCHFDEAQKLCPSEYWLRDGVHPTAQGHELIKRQWIKCFEENFR